MQEIVLCGRVICPNHAVRTLGPLADLVGVFAVPEGEGFDDCAAAVEMIGFRAERVNYEASNCAQKNAALSLLKTTHPNAWVLFLDVGETWKGGALPELDPAAEAYRVAVGPETSLRPELRLAKISACSQFVGGAAEYLNLKGNLAVGDLSDRYGVGLAVPSQEELRRIETLLQEERLRDPHNQRWAFWLGETLRAMGKALAAAEQYDQCVRGSIDQHGVFLESDGWVEERYQALVRHASLLPANQRPRLLLRAIELLPARAEAYVELAEAYRIHSQHHLAYGVAHAAVQVARTPQQGWMLDRTIQSRADDALALSAASLDLFDEALFHGSMALGAQPSSERMATNLAYYRRAFGEVLDSGRNTPSATP